MPGMSSGRSHLVLAVTDFQLPANSVNEELPYVFSGVLYSCPLHLISHPVNDILVFVIGKQSRDFPGSEKVIDDHQKLFFRYLQYVHTHTFEMK